MSRLLMRMPALAKVGFCPPRPPPMLLLCIEGPRRISRDLDDEPLLGGFHWEKRARAEVGCGFPLFLLPPPEFGPAPLPIAYTLVWYLQIEAPRLKFNCQNRKLFFQYFSCSNLIFLLSFDGIVREGYASNRP